MLVMKACVVSMVDGTNEHMPASMSSVHAFVSHMYCNATSLMVRANTVPSSSLNMPSSQDMLVGLPIAL